MLWKDMIIHKWDTGVLLVVIDTEKVPISVLCTQSCAVSLIHSNNVLKVYSSLNCPWPLHECPSN